MLFFKFKVYLWKLQYGFFYVIVYFYYFLLDLEDVVGTRPRRPSSTDEPSPLESQIVNIDLKEPATTPDCDTKIVVIPSGMD